MAEEVTKLSLQVDSTSVAAANQNLDKFTAAGKSAETAASGLEKGAQGVNTAMAGITAGADRAAAASLRVQTAQAALAQAQVRVTNAQGAFNRVLADGPARQNDFAAATARLQVAQASQAR